MSKILSTDRLEEMRVKVDEVRIDRRAFGGEVHDAIDMVAELIADRDQIFIDLSIFLEGLDRAANVPRETKG